MATKGPICTSEGGISRQVLTVLGMMNVVEGFTMNVIWPFLPFMVQAFGVASEDSVGMYVGILGTALCCENQCCRDPSLQGWVKEGNVSHGPNNFCRRQLLPGSNLQCHCLGHASRYTWQKADASSWYSWDLPG